MIGIPSGSEQPCRSTANYACANLDPKPAPSCGRGRPSKVPEETDNVSIAASSTYSRPSLAKIKDSTRSVLSSSTYSRTSVGKTLIDPEIHSIAPSSLFTIDNPNSGSSEYD